MNMSQPTPTSSISMKRNKKPKPLFGLFRKGKEDNDIIVPMPSKSQPLGSGIASSTMPFNSIQQRLNDPYSPPQMKQTPIYKNPLFSPQYPPPHFHQPQQRRQRSKSVGRDPSTNTMRLLEEREMTLNKLCGNSPDSTSLADSLPLLSPTYNNTKTFLPPVPPIPIQHQLPSPVEPSRPSVRKFSSAHDLRKATKLQQDSIQQATAEALPPVPKTPTKSTNMTRSRSLSASSRKVKLSPQHTKSPPLLPKQTTRHWPPVRREEDSSEDDDDVPLGYLQSPVSRPSSLLSDQDDEDDNDLVPIAVLNVNPNVKARPDKDKDYQTAADKYKERVKERLHFDKDEDDDDIPISLALLSPKDRAKWKQQKFP
ncbi:uncharacterized protein B0P05DRAFT_535183 [Gilbertella persicaria]|uniref:Uncharacterized protein n=1 Tax=Rhizopus stolonifer TaxID=4846 RepID=A0A367KPK7_RHIST|nr:uncharacterized protein B0P05DRAFT_535183 [Gilbertella persicaria]KAI8084351.1 hypothetical protein B0P05DRAFT_535183 [Gilbertella persicaria]RCI04154.1 hypothetical protein CU098_012181 [Rhizopus stolonifer]